MCDVAGKLEFMVMRAVKVCPKAGVGRRPEHKNPCFGANFRKSGFGTDESLWFKFNFIKLYMSYGENYDL